MASSCDSLSPYAVFTAANTTIPVVVPQEPGGERDGEIVEKPCEEISLKEPGEEIMETPGEEIVEKSGKEISLKEPGEEIVEAPGEEISLKEPGEEISLKEPVEEIVEKSGKEISLKEPGEEIVETPGEEISLKEPDEEVLEKLCGELEQGPGGEPNGETGLGRVKPYALVHPVTEKNRVGTEPNGSSRGFVSTFGSTESEVFLCCFSASLFGRLFSLIRGLFSLLRGLFSLHPTPAAPDDIKDDEKQWLLHQEFGLAPIVHVTPVKMKNHHVGISGDVSIVGDGVEDDPTDSLAAVTVHPPERVTANITEVVASAWHTDDVVVDVAAEETTTVDLGDLENSIEVGVLSWSDYELILEVCPSLG